MSVCAGKKGEALDGKPMESKRVGRVDVETRVVIVRAQVEMWKMLYLRILSAAQVWPDPMKFYDAFISSFDDEPLRSS